MSERARARNGSPNPVTPGATHVNRQDDPYDDPANLTKVYPFATYAPTARVAAHISPHTVVYPTPSSSADTYPQQAELFRRIDQPSTAEDWAIRMEAQRRAAELLRTRLQGYGGSYIPTPQSSAGLSPTVPFGSGAPIQPLPYAFLPSYLPSPSQNPPTPTSMTGDPSSPSGHLSGQEYFDDYINRAVPPHRQTDPNGAGPSTYVGPRHDREGSITSMASTPTISRAVSRMQLTPGQSPDPLTVSLPGPSPTKRQKPSQDGRTSPTLRRAQSYPRSGAPGNGHGSSATLPLATQGASKRSGLPTNWRTSLAASPAKSRDRAYVELPGKGSNSGRSPSKRDDEDEEDELDWSEDERRGAEQDEDWEMMGPFQSPSPGGGRSGALRITGRARTGERDMRSSVEKLQTLFEDIFEEADAIPAEPIPEDLSSSKFFDRLSKDGTHPLLTYASIESVIRHVGIVQGNKRRQNSLDADPTWDEEALKRLFRLLEKSMAEADGVEVFPEDRRASGNDKKLKKRTKRMGKKTSKSPSVGDEAEAGLDDEMENELGEEAVAMHEERLETLRIAGAAAQCSLIVLDTEGLSKPMYSEDLLSTCVTILREQMTKVIFPYLAAVNSEKVSSLYLGHLLSSQAVPIRKGKTLGSAFQHPTITAIAQIVIASIPRLSHLISRPDISFSDGLVIQIVYLAIAPLFIAEPGGQKKRGKEGRLGGGIASVAKALRMEALGCLRGAFAKYEDQRQWIIEEILGSLVKIPESNASATFQLSDGSSINTISALLLQLIQAATHGLVSRVRKLRASVQELALEGISKENKDGLAEEARLCSDAIDSALRSAKIVAGYLVQKSINTRGNKTSHDTDYKAVLDIFVADLLNVLYRPEWPAAALFVSLFSKIFVNAAEDASTSPEASAAKNVALDFLGDIGSKLKILQTGEQWHSKPISSLDVAISIADPNGAKSLISAQQTLRTFLCAAGRNDAMSQSAQEMSTITWAQELQVAIGKLDSLVDKLAGEKGEEAEDERERLQSLLQLLQSTSRDLWVSSDDSLFEVSGPKQSDVALQASLAIARGRSLQAAFDPILRALIGCMDLPAVGLRSKALRGLSSVVSADPDLLSLINVREAIEERLSDSSPAVRDAAVELVGKFVLQRPTLVKDYYHHIALRVSDTGLAVRKRVIKLLRSIFASTELDQVMVDVCCKIISLVGDKDDSVKDLAIKTLVEMLYPANGGEKIASADLLVETIGEFEGGEAALEEGLNGVLRECSATGRASRVAETVDGLISRLIDATEQADFDAYSTIKAISLLCAGQPTLIDTNQAAVLLTYLRPPQNSEEQAKNDLLLRIFQSCIPYMPRTASNFATDLTKALTPMINKPHGGFGALKEIIGCLCVVVTHLMRDYSLLIKVLRSCEAQIQGMRNDLTQSGAVHAQVAKAGMMLYICALIAERCNLDQMALSDESLRADLARICDGPLFEHLFDIFLDFAKMPIPQHAPTVCFGCLFRTYPALTLRDETMAWMDAAFGSPDSDNHARLLGVLHDFMVSEAKKKAAGGQKAQDMSALIGSAPELSDSGVATSVLQRNIKHVLDGAKSHHVPTQTAAMDVLAFTVNQGLYHPLQCMPILVSLETSEDPATAERALALHSTLHQKHSALVNVRYLDFAKAAYEYQRTVTSDVSGQRGGVALLAGWYGLSGGKRAWKHEFLRALGRVFDHDTGLGKAIDPSFMLFIADNLASFEYKLQEEVMTVIQQLSQVVSTCSPLVGALERATVRGAPKDPLEGRRVAVAESEEDWGSAIALIHSSVVVCLALLAKNHLASAYGLTEEKCVKHQPGKKSAIGDRPAVRKGLAAGLDVGRVPLVRGVETVGDFEAQKAVFLQLLEEDGIIDRGDE